MCIIIQHECHQNPSCTSHVLCCSHPYKGLLCGYFTLDVRNANAYSMYYPCRMDKMSYTEQRQVGMYPCLNGWWNGSGCTQISGVRYVDVCICKGFESCILSWLDVCTDLYGSVCIYTYMQLALHSHKCMCIWLTMYMHVRLFIFWWWCRSMPHCILL